NPSVAGGPVTLTATVSGGPGIGGPVTFMNGSSELKTVTLSGGSASTTVTTLSTGTHALKAIYTGSDKYLGSESAVLSHRVNAGSGSGSVSSGSVSSGSTGGGSGGVGAPPPGSRLQVLGTPKTVVTGKGGGKNKVRWVTLPAPAGATGAALTVVARASKRPTTLAVCAANVGKQACAGQKLMTLDRRSQQARSAVVQLPAPRVMLWNKAGKARVTVMVQGWYVNDATRLKGTALSSAQKVVKGKRLGAGQAYTLTVPAALRPSGTKAVELQVRATKATRNAAVGVCRPAAGRSACLSRPAVYGDPGSAAANWVVVRVGKNGKVKLVNGGGSVKLAVHLTAVYLPS
ncbi:MAG TPA: Ig-like domain-containing protein, partial [Actinoplanes sp.]|nr:Ig-like domain-containing protein [Actinoplanes sp.]